MKSIQIKIVMIFAIIGIVVIATLGIFSLYRLEIATSSLAVNELETKALINEQANQIEIAIYISLGVFVLFTIVGG